MKNSSWLFVVIIVLCAGVLIGRQVHADEKQYQDSMDRNQQAILNSERSETVSVITDKYKRTFHYGNTHHTHYYIDVYNGDMDPYSFEISRKLWNSASVTDNVKLIIYTVDGELYNVFIVTDVGEHIPCKNYIALRDGDR